MAVLWFLLLSFGIGPAATEAVAVYEFNQRLAAGRSLLYGDVLLSPKQLRLRRYRNSAGKVDPKLILHIAVKERANNRWPNNRIPYQISNRYFPAEKSKLLKAFRTLEEHSCFKFVPHSDEIDYLFVEKMEGCFSFVGRIGGRQLVSLASGCLYDYIIWHELMHALGLEHEHQRPDRDRYIRIQYENVDPEKLLNFELIPAVDVDLYHGYDYTSIMHYDGRAFGRFDPVSRRPMITMVPLKSEVELIDNLVLTEMDTEKLRLLGGCPPRLLSITTTETSDGSDGSPADSSIVDNGTPQPLASTRRTPIIDDSVVKSGLVALNSTELENTSPNEESITIAARPDAPCANRSAECARFLDKGHCSNYRYKRMMLLYCPVSCGYCDSVAK